MNKNDLIKVASDFVEKAEDNLISKEVAISENVVGIRIFQTPLFACAKADDEKFYLLKDPSSIGKHFILPQEWLPQAKTVISFFLPFTEKVRESNARDMSWPSEEWLHGRIEGQAFINKLCLYLKSELLHAGYQCIVPSLDERFWVKLGLHNISPYPDNTEETFLSFTSNWSERHVAFVCGQGTFGLSKGLITRKGIAGRFGSIITDLPLSPDKRDYQDIYEYCLMCGACGNNCPANAISIEKGKNHKICAEFLDKTALRFKPRVGCGKCQINVPCESRRPGKNSLTI
ncbi:MAG: 4Fe-4S binding protein [Deltaproteobacteria bacterium]|nr:4Fe-4S binding protein [Deltaproteobacteria bacterium]